MINGGRHLSFGSHVLTILAVASTLLASAFATPARADETFGVTAPVRTKAAKPQPVLPSTQLHVDMGGSPLVVLEPMDNRTLLLQDELAGDRSKVLRIGVAREVRVRAEDGAWTQLADGTQLWSAEVVSPNALAMRLHFADLALPAGAELAVYGVDGSAGFGAGPAGAPELLRGGNALASHWSGTVSGERARIEYLAPAGNDTAALPFRVDQLQHIYRDPIAEAAFVEKAAGSCHNDSTCFPEWAGEAASVARYTFIIPGALVSCTGQLINDLSSDFTPFFLTANHCVDSSFEASTTEFFWFYQTASCGGPPPSLGSVPRSQGATLISTNPSSDYTILQVEGALPDGLFWSGWTSVKPGLGVDTTAIHHPSGDYKRISFGFNDNPSICPANHVTISWTDGPTEVGSSGGAVWRDDTHQIIGQLHGGPSSCGNETYDCYGAFSSTYAKVKKLLKAGTDDKSDPNDSCSKPRTVKAGTLTNRIVKVNDTDWYRFSVPAGKSLTVRVDFANSNGDIDLAIFGSCGSDPVDFSRTTGDSETVTVTNVSNKPAFAIWQVYLYSDTRNNYDQTVFVH